VPTKPEDPVIKHFLSDNGIDHFLFQNIRMKIIASINQVILAYTIYFFTIPRKQ
jgi:hypothetical protein